MNKARYTIHSSDEKDKYVVVKDTHPYLVIHIEHVDYRVEISRIVLMENCSPSDLGKILLEFEKYIQDNLIPKMGTRAS